MRSIFKLNFCQIIEDLYKHSLILVSFGAVFFINQPIEVLASNHVSLLSLADSLYQYENYDDAITEYKRFIVFYPNNSKLASAYYKIGMAYQNLGEWANSTKYFLHSIEFSNNDDFVNNSRISMAVSGIAEGNYIFALLELQKVLLYSQSNKLLKKAHFFQTVTYVYLEDWEEARQSFQLFILSVDYDKFKPIVQEIDSLLIDGNNIKYKSPSKAKWISTFIPGGGQLYSKNYRNAINAFLLNGINFGFTFHLIRDQAYLDAALFFLYIGIRYYTGNRYHAQRLTNEYNSKKISTFKSNTFKYLLELSKEL